jgi:hypothetical protein
MTGIRERKKTHDVFGVSNTILVDSYVDRGNIDDELTRYLDRKMHIALRGESKCGKSWVRQKNIPNAIIVQCRLKKRAIDIYVDALSQLGIKLIVQQTSGTAFKGSIEAEGSLGVSLLGKIGLNATADVQKENGATSQPIGHDINDLRFIVELIIASGKRLVIEDFHYLSIDERKNLAFDLKTLWDYGCFVIIIGVWSQSNMLIYLNPDLSGRIVEIQIYWTEEALRAVIVKGCKALNIELIEPLKNILVKDSFGNVGILQQLMLMTLDEARISEAQEEMLTINNDEYIQGAATKYADQLNALYQQFAKRVSKGIRLRKDATGIYAHAMSVIMAADNESLIKGLSAASIYENAHAKQNRIQKSNLTSILSKLGDLQTDDDGRGLVLAYNEATQEITIVDRQLLFYRKYLTVSWPWEDLIKESETTTEVDRQDI